MFSYNQKHGLLWWVCIGSWLWAPLLIFAICKGAVGGCKFIIGKISERSEDPETTTKKLNRLFIIGGSSLALVVVLVAAVFAGSSDDAPGDSTDAIGPVETNAETETDTESYITEATETETETDTETEIETEAETTDAPVTEAETEKATEAVTETDAVTEKETDPPETEKVEITYVLNTNTEKFHYLTCNSVDDIDPSNYAVYTGTREEVIKKGYVPCKRCCP